MSVTLPQLPPLATTLPPLGKINLNGATIEKTRGLRKVSAKNSKKKHSDEENDENENSEEENENGEDEENTEENEEDMNHEKDEEKSYSSENDVSPAVQSKK